MKKLILAIFAMISVNSYATDIVMYDTKISSIYTQSRDGSTAHLVKLEKDMDNECSSNRLYIDFEDQALYTAALTYFVTGKSVDVVYNTQSASRLARRHAASTCKLISIF